MNSSAIGMMDFLIEREDWKADEDSLRKTLFSSDYSSALPSGIIKQEINCFETGSPDLKNMCDSLNIDEVLGSFFVDSDGSVLSQSTAPLSGGDYDLGSLKDFEFLPFDPIINPLSLDSVQELNESASDSGISNNDNVTDSMLSPSSGLTSPEPGGDISVDMVDAISDVSSSSDLDSVTSLGSSPGRPSSQDFSVGFNRTVRLANQDLEMQDVISQNSIVLSEKVPDFEFNKSFSSVGSTAVSNQTSTTAYTVPRIKVETISPTRFVTLKNFSSSGSKSPIVTKVRLDSSVGGLSPITKTTGRQTIVVTQAGKGTPLLSNGTTLLKATAGTRSLLLPVNISDLNKVKTIKIISSGSANSTVKGTGVRTMVSTIKPSAMPISSQGGARTTFFTTSKCADGRSLLKVTPTALVAPTNCGSNITKANVTPATFTIKEEEEPIVISEESPQPNQRLVLTEEEQRLMRKEGLVLPSCYPLTKQEERDLKRIRRKIRNKISAQDSRKRKKEYVDKLEDRVKKTTDENQQLHKRIRNLEKQNETLVTQLKRFQSIVGTSLQNRSHNHASTALMMLILSAALFVVPSLRPQEGQGENELSSNTKMPSVGHSRSLLEAGTSPTVGMKSNLELYEAVEEEEEDGGETPPFSTALSDHDYSPLAKKPRFDSEKANLFSPPDVDRTYSPDDGDPPDSKGGLNGVAALFGAMLDRLGSNWTDPGGSVTEPVNKSPNGTFGEGNIGSSVVVSLGRDRRLREDIELE